MIGKLDGQDPVAWGENIKQLVRVFEVSNGTLHTINHRRILDAISFPDMNTKRSLLDQSPASDGTYEHWLTSNDVPESHKFRLAMSFRTWLAEGQGIFHIAGKPGSGKSTLMHLLSHHEETTTLLNSWGANGGGMKTVKACVYLQKFDSSMEKSLERLQRTLLYSILDQHRQDLIPRVFPQHWNPEDWRPWTAKGDIKINIKKKEIEVALNQLLTGSPSGYQYCIFIDGADDTPAVQVVDKIMKRPSPCDFSDQ